MEQKQTMYIGYREPDSKQVGRKGKRIGDKNGQHKQAV